MVWKAVCECLPLVSLAHWAIQTWTTRTFNVESSVWSMGWITYDVTHQVHLTGHLGNKHATLVAANCLHRCKTLKHNIVFDA